MDSQSFGDVTKIKQLAKHEVLVRQKVEKLSEELQQQRNRRHGYVLVIIDLPLIFQCAFLEWLCSMK